MPRTHDRGGWATNEPIDRSEHHLEDWEQRTDALLFVLNRKGVTTVDQHRRAIEGLSQKDYESLSYYEKWAAAIEILLVEKRVLSEEAISKKARELSYRWGSE